MNFKPTNLLGIILGLAMGTQAFAQSLGSKASAFVQRCARVDANGEAWFDEALAKVSTETSADPNFSQNEAKTLQIKITQNTDKADYLWVTAEYKATPTSKAILLSASLPKGAETYLKTGSCQTQEDVGSLMLDIHTRARN